VSNYRSALSIDFGEVGFRYQQQPFRLRLLTDPLADLILAAEEAHRVYELLLIDRPGDIWDYVWVVVDVVPQSIADLIATARGEAQPKKFGGPHPWPEDRIPFNAFDALFSRHGYDNDREDEAWIDHRDAPEMLAFAQQTMSLARGAQSRVGRSDYLLRHIALRVRSGEHPYCYLERDVARRTGRYLSPNKAQHTAAFYKKLAELLGDADLASVAYRARGDYCVLRMIATEQRRRAALTGHTVGNALFLSALVDHKISNEAWESEIWLAHGDLHIEGGGIGGNLKELVESGYRVPGRFILSSKDEGSMSGFTAETGDGWVVYRNDSPDSRRTALELISHRRLSEMGAVLSFADSGATLFSFDKTVVLIGSEVSTAARAVVSQVMREWERLGGDPIIVVLGDCGPFEKEGCKGVLAVDAGEGDDIALASWLYEELERSRPWIDAVIALHAPAWAAQGITNRTRYQNGPWPVWVVATPGASCLNVDHLLDGDLEELLVESQRRAKSTRRLLC